jgi:hypothetical protein
MAAVIPAIEIALPFRLNGGGGIAFTSDFTEQIRAHVFSLIGTARGERVMRGDYGTDTIASVFTGITPGLLSRIQDDIMSAATTFAPEVTVTKIDTVNTPGSGLLNLTVHFVVNQSQQQALSTTITIPVQ